MRKRTWLRFLWRCALAVAIPVSALAAYLFIPGNVAPAPDIAWGATFTKSYAEYLGLDWRAAYLAVLDDLKVDTVRIGINWDEIEQERGAFRFDDYDWMIGEADRRGVEVLAAVGFKLPRWPECRAPAWASALPEKAFQDAQLEMIRATVEHFRPYGNIKVWQMENEAFIEWFGQCPRMSDALARRKADLVRATDPSRPIAMTESGELATWIKSALAADQVGVSMYRMVWNQWQGYSRYEFPPSYYARKAKLASALAPGHIPFFISELQLEIWSPQGVLQQPVAEQTAVFTTEYMRETFDFARRTGFDRIYTWGAEWWYWMRGQGHPEYWEAAKEEMSRD